MGFIQYADAVIKSVGVFLQPEFPNEKVFFPVSQDCLGYNPDLHLTAFIDELNYPYDSNELYRELVDPIVKTSFIQQSGKEYLVLDVTMPDFGDRLFFHEFINAKFLEHEEIAIACIVEPKHGIGKEGQRCNISAIGVGTVVRFNTSHDCEVVGISEKVRYKMLSNFQVQIPNNQATINNIEFIWE